MSWDSYGRLIVTVAGALSFCQLPAVVAAPRLMRWREEFAGLAPVNRRIVLVLAIAVILTVQGTGIVAIVGASEIAAGTPLGTATAGFLGVFWSYRAAIQFWYGPVWPRHNFLLRLTHSALACLFSAQAVLFLAAFVHGLVG
jgi:hypothetical protein